MLLPSALPCDLLAPLPLRRSTRLSPAPEPPASTPHTLLQTCRRLQTILSLPAPTPAPAAATPSSSGLARRRAASPSPLKRARPDSARPSRTPQPSRPNKRSRADDPATPRTPDNKRTRIATPPPAPDRGPARDQKVDGDALRHEAELARIRSGGYGSIARRRGGVVRRLRR